jgi:exocyst complex component 5
MEKSVRQAEREFSGRMRGLNDNFEVRSTDQRRCIPLISQPKEVSKSFAGMESKISEVGRTAIRIGALSRASCRPEYSIESFKGEQLESVHSSRQRAQAAHDLIDYYIQFSRNDTTKLDILRKESGKEGRMKLAVLLRRMNTAAKEVDIPIAEQVCHTRNRPPILLIREAKFNRPKKLLTNTARSLRRIC